MYKIETSISTSSWQGCGHYDHPEYTGETLEQALNILYAQCKYSNSENRNLLHIYDDKRSHTIYFTLPNYEGTGVVKKIRYIDKDNNCIIFEEEKYEGSKCRTALNNYKEKLDDIAARNSVHGDF